MHIGKWLLRSSNIFCNFFNNIISFCDFIFHASEIRTVLLEVSIDLGLLKKSLFKTSKIVLMYSNSIARHFSSMFLAKCLLPRLDRLLLVRSCLQNFYQWWWHYSVGDSNLYHLPDQPHLPIHFHFTNFHFYVFVC